MKNENYVRTLTDSQINTIMYLSNQGKIDKIKTIISEMKKDYSITKKEALKKIKSIVDEKNEGLWKAAQEGKLEKMKSSEINKVDIEQVKLNLNSISDYCIKNLNNNILSKNKALDKVKSICNNANKNTWVPIEDELLKYNFEK